MPVCVSSGRVALNGAAHDARLLPLPHRWLIVVSPGAYGTARKLPGGSAGLKSSGYILNVALTSMERSVMYVVVDTSLSLGPTGISEGAW